MSGDERTTDLVATPPAGHADRAAEWFYTGLWRIVAEWFRVPHAPPAPPVGNAGTHESLRPAPGFLRYLELRLWIVLALIDVPIFAGWLALTISLRSLGILLLPVVLAVAIIPAPVVYAALHLRYHATWYVLTDLSMRIRRGIWTIHETTITFENVQNVKVVQGPLQRAFDISNVIVETAGASVATGPQGQELVTANQGVLEGVADGERVRDLMLDRLRQSRSAGLGDEQDLARAASIRWTRQHLDVLRTIRDELRLLAGGVG